MLSVVASVSFPFPRRGRFLYIHNQDEAFYFHSHLFFTFMIKLLIIFEKANDVLTYTTPE